jgi:hypothetical protein
VLLSLKIFLFDLYELLYNCGRYHVFLFHLQIVKNGSKPYWGCGIGGYGWEEIPLNADTHVSAPQTLDLAPIPGA